MSDEIVSDLGYWCQGLNERLNQIREIIRGMPAGWSIADRLQGVGNKGTGQTPATIKALLKMAKDLHGQHERWPVVQKLIDELAEDLVVYEAVLRLLAGGDGGNA
jgi:hypothetical protein